MKPFSMMAWAQSKRCTAIGVMLACCCLSGCDKGDANKEAEREQAIKEGDSRATGSACRQAGRALEDCYNMNPTSQRASVFAGWRDMNDYMRENKIPDVKPTGEMPKSADASAEGAAKDDSGHEEPKPEESKH